MNQLSIDIIRAALSCIPASMPRDEWARVAMALKSELSESGFELFDNWSKQSDAYNAKATRDTWKSVKAGGRVKIGTLIHLAKSHGFQFEEVAQKPVANEAERKAQARARLDREKHEHVERETAHRAAAVEAAKQWTDASETGECEYLARKGVQGHGVRYTASGWLLVPVRDAAGELWNVQRIAPQKPVSGPDKLFLKGGRKSGLWHCIGDPKSAPIVLIAEGYATAATLHEATGLPVVIAFDAGNLANVARTIRKANTSALLIVCGDDDTETQAKSGRNPGREAAQAAADRSRAIAIFPEGLADGGSDFKDMAAHSGTAAVRECVEGAIKAASEPKKSKGEGKDLSQNSAALLDRFTADADGVWFADYDTEGRSKSPVWVCTRLAVPALTRDADGQGWGYLLEFTDPAGHARQWAMPARMLAGDGTEFRGVLMAFGLRIAASTRARALLAQYIQTRQPTEHAQCTDRIG